MKIAIVGWGIEGQSAFKYFGPEHDYLIVNEEPRDDFPEESDKIHLQFLRQARPVGMVSMAKDLSYLEGVKDCDKVVYQPSSYNNLHQAIGEDSAFWDKATTVQDIFFEEVKTKNIIGVTGTKGKGTTSTLIHLMLEAAGKTSNFAGNVGKSVLDLLAEVKQGDWVVLELSSFQLNSITHSPHIAVCLMVVPEHMDWHGDMESYIAAKSNLFKYQKPEDIAIYYAKSDNSQKIAAVSPGKKIPFYESPGAYVRDDGMIVIAETEVINKNEVKLLGEHNLQNICAALTTVFAALGSIDKAKAVLSSFSGLEHRLEPVRTLEGIKYYNDSFAATPDAAIGAIRAIPGPKVMIIGGFDRHLPLENFVRDIQSGAESIRKIVLIGQSAKRVAESLTAAGFDNFVINDSKEMNAILSQAKELSQDGDSIVLSPGFASFDMFKNFEARGQEFKKAVNNL